MLSTSVSTSPSSCHTATEKPLAAVSRKLKSAIGSDQRPSVRIVRNRPVEGSPHAEQVHNEYDSETVDLLDLVDPEVSTLSTLTNIQNSLFVPRLGPIVNRRATYRTSETPQEVHRLDRLRNALSAVANRVQDKLGGLTSSPLPRRASISSQISDAHYAVLPSGATLIGWTPAQKEELDDRVRHMLHSRRSMFMRSLRGFGKYVRRPLGLFITVYATLITLFGAAWVFFLIGWISLGSRRDYIINVVDNVLVALFAVIGDGLAPFRAVDTYHMIHIAYYHRKTWKLRDEMGLAKLVDHNDLPDARKKHLANHELDFESLVARKMPRRWAPKVAPRIPKRLAHKYMSRKKNSNPTQEYTVLTPEQQEKLEHHERKFSKSHTFYKPHETATHYAFPLKLLVAIVVLLDLHSCLQITLGACTWGISYKTRPFALTTVILCCSITCNIMGGVLISIGDKRTRKVVVLERMMRQELTAEAIEAMEMEWMKAGEEQGTIDPAIRQQRDEHKERQETAKLKSEWKAVPLLPKILLGKGEDHREPALPQHERRSHSKSDSAASFTSQPSKQQTIQPLPPLQENVNQTRHGQETVTPHGSKTQRMMKYIRRADNGKS